MGLMGFSNKWGSQKSLERQEGALRRAIMAISEGYQVAHRKQTSPYRPPIIHSTYKHPHQLTLTRLRTTLSRSKLLKGLYFRGTASALTYQERGILWNCRQLQSVEKHKS